MKQIWIMVCVVLACLMGCTSRIAMEREETEAEDIEVIGKEAELTLFDKNSKRHFFDDRIAQKIMEKTGVSIHVIDSTEDAAGKEEQMFTMKEYPDMIKVELEAINKYEDAGYLVDLEPYLSMLPSVTEMYGDMLKKMRTEDGKLFYLGNWYGKDTDAAFGFQIRYDYLKELVGKERADSDEPFTEDEFLALLRRFSEKYPQIGEEKMIPFTVCKDYGYLESLHGMYGLKRYSVQNGRVRHLARDANYKNMIEFMNQMYREKLLDKEWILNRKELYQKKLVSGRVFATACAYWDVQEVNAELRKINGEDSFFACYKVLGDGIKENETTYGGRNSIGWDAIAITDHCTNIDAALKVIDFLASEEGQYLMLWGIEGEDWNYVDGVRTPKEKNVEMFTRDIADAIEKTDIRRWIWFIKNGNGKDGTPYDMMTKYQVSREAELANRRMADDYWDISEFLGLEPENGTEESLMWTKIENIYDKAFPRIIDAESRGEMQSLYYKLLRDMEEEGLSKVEDVWTRNYLKRVK